MLSQTQQLATIPQYNILYTVTFSLYIYFTVDTLAPHQNKHQHQHNTQHTTWRENDDDYEIRGLKLWMFDHFKKFQTC